MTTTGRVASEGLRWAGAVMAEVIRRHATAASLSDADGFIDPILETIMFRLNTNSAFHLKETAGNFDQSLQTRSVEPNLARPFKAGKCQQFVYVA